MRIAIVNDLLSAREGMRRAIVARGQDQIAWMAADGAEAVQRCQEDVPDLVLMDLLMPEMDGVQATREIMRNSPCPILVVTASIDTNISKVYQAMGAGALDAVVTPTSPNSGDTAAFFAKLEMLRRLGGKSSTRKTVTKAVRQNGSQTPSLVAIGSSAGGPFALAALLKKIPRDFAGCIAIVQHVDAHFVEGLAKWLSEQTGHRVKVARHYDTPQAGLILLAGEERHLCVNAEQFFEYREQPAEAIHKPSIDIFFESIAEHWQGEAIGIILTGMGRDGAKGLQKLKARGFMTIAQDKASSAVYGMPKAAVELDAARKVLGLEQIAEELERQIDG